MSIKRIDNGISPIFPFKKKGKEELKGAEFQKSLKEKNLAHFDETSTIAQRGQAKDNRICDQ